MAIFIALAFILLNYSNENSLAINLMIVTDPVIPSEKNFQPDNAC